MRSYWITLGPKPNESISLRHSNRGRIGHKEERILKTEAVLSVSQGLSSTTSSYEQATRQFGPHIFQKEPTANTLILASRTMRQ